MKLGIGITTHNRYDMISDSYSKISRLSPEETKIVVVDDASEREFPFTDFKFDSNVGISKAKNKCLELLDDCDHIFLFDDDTYPTAEGWWKPYIESPELHLQYNFESSPSHWSIKETSRTDDLVSYDKSRGCMLYIDRRVLGVVGGMHNVFGKHGHEHEDWSERIHKAGLTTYAFQDVPNSAIRCLDEDEADISSVSYVENKAWQYVDTAKLPLYAEYRSDEIPVIVARRNDNGHRDRIWRYLKEFQWSGRKIYEGFHVEGAFNRSLGLNLASSIAGNWDVAVFIDSDTYIDPDKITKAVTMARNEQKVVSPFTRVVELNKEATLCILDAHDALNLDPEDSMIEKIRTEPLCTQSLVLVVPRNIYEQIGGFDEKFVGWGGEDNAFWRAAEIVAGEVLRLDGEVYHLWHVPASREYQPSNNQRWMRYRRATTRQHLRLIR